MKPVGAAFLTPNSRQECRSYSICTIGLHHMNVNGQVD